MSNPRLKHLLLPALAALLVGSALGHPSPSAVATARVAVRLGPPAPPALPPTALPARTVAAQVDTGESRTAPVLQPAAAAPPAAPATPAPMKVASVHYPLADRSAHFHGAPNIPAASGILFDMDTHTIIWERNPDERRAPASTTKMLSVLVALENLPLDRLVTVTDDAMTSDPQETRLGLIPGEQLTVAELLKGMLMISANDAANAVAADTVGYTRFVDTMNAQVAALGLHDSHFVTPVGLDDPEQYSSAHDLGVIGAVAMERHGWFRDIAGRQNDDLPGSPLHRDYPLPNIDRLLKTYPGAMGVKPGYTWNAGPCLVTMAERGNHRLMAVVMNAPRMYDTVPLLLDWAFAQERLGVGL